MWARFLYGRVIGPYPLPSNLTGDAYFIFHEYKMTGLLEDVHQNTCFQHDRIALHFTRSPRSFGSTFSTKIKRMPLTAPHSPFRIWTEPKRSEKIPGAPVRRWGEWIWLTESSGLYRNSRQVLNISFIKVFDQIRDPEIPLWIKKITVLTHSQWFHNEFVKISVPFY